MCLTKYQSALATEGQDDSRVHFGMITLINRGEVRSWHVLGVDDVLDPYGYPMKGTSLVGGYGVEGPGRRYNDIRIEVRPALYHWIALLYSGDQSFGTIVSTEDSEPLTILLP
jgi:hypothetical protein